MKEGRHDFSKVTRLDLPLGVSIDFDICNSTDASQLLEDFKQFMLAFKNYANSYPGMRVCEIRGGDSLRCVPEITEDFSVQGFLVYMYQYPEEHIKKSPDIQRIAPLLIQSQVMRCGVGIGAYLDKSNVDSPGYAYINSHSAMVEYRKTIDWCFGIPAKAVFKTPLGKEVNSILNLSEQLISWLDFQRECPQEAIVSYKEKLDKALLMICKEFGKERNWKDGLSEAQKCFYMPDAMQKVFSTLCDDHIDLFQKYCKGFDYRTDILILSRMDALQSVFSEGRLYDIERKMY